MIDVVSVEGTVDNMYTEIRWNKPSSVSSKDLGYVIHEYVGPFSGCYTPLDTIFGMNNTIYTHNGYSSGGYGVTVFDSSGISSTFPRYHKPPEITEIRYDTCDFTVHISWTRYVGWEEGADYYSVYTVTPYLMTGYTPENDTSFSFAWEPNTYFYVQADTKDLSSNSRSKRYMLSDSVFSSRYDTIRLMRIEQQSDGKAALHFAINTTTEISAFHIQRAAAKADFETIYSFTDKTQNTYVDNTATEAYQYRVIAMNYCGNIICISDTLQNFILSMTPEDNKWKLQWSPRFTGSRYTFSLQRTKPGSEDVNVTGNTAIDAISDMSAESSLEYCYRLEALTPRGSISVSSVCDFYIPIIAMPDAIDPFGNVKNVKTGRRRNQFAPLINAHPATYKYRLSIVNRNGAKIADIEKAFGSNLQTDFWDGRFGNGDAVPEDVYIYNLEVEFQGGHKEIRTGSVVVIYQ
ncbi:MAG: hypothetical protein LBT48_06945 [Prevotellaceae bacterium]|jgi:hypothetical protein|nr:hypothetical protein [Prevotellaceae bacterium]